MFVVFSVLHFGVCVVCAMTICLRRFLWRRVFSLICRLVSPVLWLFLFILIVIVCSLINTVFFFNDPATPEFYTYCHTLPLHDALPIYRRQPEGAAGRARGGCGGDPFPGVGHGEFDDRERGAG